MYLNSSWADLIAFLQASSRVFPTPRPQEKKIFPSAKDFSVSQNHSEDFVSVEIRELKIRTIQMEKIKVFYDGTDLKNFQDHPSIVGFTTNISFLKKAGISDYGFFITESLTYAKGRPISFQLYDDDDDGIRRTARKISSYGKNVFVISVCRRKNDRKMITKK